MRVARHANKSCRLVGLVVSCCLISTGIAIAQVLPSQASSGQAAPPAQAAFVPGDLVIIAQDNVQFGVRDQPMLTVSTGMEMRVTELRGKWVGGYVMIDGQKQLGWVRDTEIRKAHADAGRSATAPNATSPNVPGPNAVDPNAIDDPQAVSVLRELGVVLHADDQGRTRELVGAGSRLNDAQLEQLKKLPHLLSIDVSGLPLTDDGLRHLGSCRGLQNLYLAETKITDAGLIHLRNLQQLEVLSVPKTSVTGKGLTQLEALKNLRVLNLGHCQVGDEDLKHLAAFPHLEIVTLPQTQVTDEGLTHLRPVTKLRVLNLDGTAITGSGFDHLLGLTELRMLYVRRCKVEPDRIDKLDNELPGLAIYD